MNALSVERPRIARALWWNELVTAAIQREWTLNLGQRSAYERLAHLLIELYMRLATIGSAQNGRCDFPLTQNDLAETTGPDVGPRQSDPPGTAPRWPDRAGAQAAPHPRSAASDGSVDVQRQLPAPGSRGATSRRQRLKADQALKNSPWAALINLPFRIARINFGRRLHRKYLEDVFVRKLPAIAFAGVAQRRSPEPPLRPAPTPM